MALPTVGVPRETVARERRVALDPAVVKTLVAGGHAVLVESGAGVGAGAPDESYRGAGATVTDRRQVLASAELVTAVRPVDPAELHRGQVLLGLLGPLADPASALAYAEAGIDTISLDLLPRTVSSAQTMDALTSQANVAGYKAAVLAADAYGGFFPMLMTAAGTIRPASVLVLGGGVAGLQAIGTAVRLGAVVDGYDVRPEARGDIESVGGRFVTLAADIAVSGEGGYARALTTEESAAQQAALTKVIAAHDVVIATAAVPGRRPPLLVTADALDQMRAGSVLVDLAASPLGGNVAGSAPGKTTSTPHGVTVMGADDLPSRMAAPASAAYSHNVLALISHLEVEGALLLTDTADPIRADVVVTHGGAVVQPAVLEQLGVPHEHQPVR